MNNDKKKLYILSCIYAGALLTLCCILGSTYLKLALAVFSAVFFLLFNTFIKKRSIKAIEHRQVLTIMTVSALMFIGIFFITGLKFGFYKTTFQTGFLWQFIIPITITIAFSEKIREKMLAQQDKFASAISYFSLCLIDIFLLIENDIFKKFESFNNLVSMIIFPTITANILYHFISKRYGALPNIIYKILIFTFPFFTPSEPAVPEALLAFAKLLLPLILMMFIRSLYVKRQKKVSRRAKAVGTALTAITIFLMAGIVMLISCQFRFGLLVIATESMTGEIDKGDAIIYEQYDCQIIKEGQVLVFNKNKQKTVHRVVDIENINGQTRYYTKGDANDGNDVGYITNEDIVGVLKLKIKYLGYPTILVRELFK